MLTLSVVSFCNLQNTAWAAERSFSLSADYFTPTISQSLVSSVSSSTRSAKKMRIIEGLYYKDVFVPGVTIKHKFVPGITISGRFIRGIFVEGNFVPGMMNHDGTKYIPGLVYKGTFFPGMFNGNGTFTFGKLVNGRPVPGYVSGNVFRTMQLNNATVDLLRLSGPLEMGKNARNEDVQAWERGSDRPDGAQNQNPPRNLFIPIL